MVETAKDDTDGFTGGHRLGTDLLSSPNPVDSIVGTSARERALTAAKKQAREAKGKSKDKSLNR
jgi:hypothetical protein